MSQSSSQSISGDVTFGNKSNESPWLIPGLIIGAVLLGIAFLIIRKKKG